LESGVGPDPSWSIIERYGSPFEHDDPGTESLDELDIVFDDEYRLAECSEPLYHGGDIGFHPGRDSGGWFVEEKYLGASSDRACYLQEAELPPRQGVGPVVRFRGEPQLAERFEGARPECPA